MKNEKIPGVGSPRKAKENVNDEMHPTIDKDFYDFLAFAVVKWSKRHVVIINKRLIELWGSEVFEMRGELK